MPKKNASAVGAVGKSIRSFGDWLADMRKREHLTQREAVEKMRLLSPGKRVRVSVWTWCRWESGVRLPPRTKIDLVAKVLNQDSKRVRRKAGYHVPERSIRRDRNDVVATMLREVSPIVPSEVALLRMYAIISAYVDYGDGTAAARMRKLNLDRMRAIVRIFDKLKVADEAAFLLAVDGFGRVLRELGYW